MSVTRSDSLRATVAPSGGLAEPGIGSTDAENGAARQRDSLPVELRVLGVVAVIVGIVLRFVAPSPLWLDEALSINIARLALGELPEALGHDGHPPLFYALLHVWMNVFGEGDQAVRALPGVFSLAALPLGYLAGKRRGGPLLGTLMLALLALSPFALRYATETRMYSLLVFLVLAGYLLLDDIVRQGRDQWTRVIGLSFVSAALLLSHYWSLWLVASVFLSLVAVRRRLPDPDMRRAADRGLIGLTAGAIAFLPWAKVLFDQAGHTGTPWAGPVRPTSLVANTLTDFGGGDFKDAQFVGGVILVLALLALFGRTVDERRIEIDLSTVAQFRFEGAVVTLTVTIGLLVSYATWSTFVTRYASVILPLVLLIAAGGITRFAARWVRFGVLASVLGLFSLGCIYNIRTDRSQARVIANEVAARAQTGDLVVYCPDQLGPAALREMPTDLVHLAYPTMNSPERIDWVDYIDRNAQADPATYAGQVMRRASGIDPIGPQVGLFVVWSGGYKTHQGSCEAFVAALAAARTQHVLVAEDGDLFYEHANLAWFPPT